MWLAHAPRPLFLSPPPHTDTEKLINIASFLSQYYALEEVSLSVTCDGGAHLTVAGCVYDYSSCNGCETRLQRTASAVSSRAADVTTAIEIIGNLSSAVEGLAALDAATAEEAEILTAIKNALDGLYLNVSFFGEDVVGSFNTLIGFKSKVSARAHAARNIFCIP